MSSVKKFLENAEESKEKINYYKKELSEEERKYKKLIEEYRVESVVRVLDHVRSEYRKGRLCNLELLLCHCQNKLRGNIDGVELDLTEGVCFTKADMAAEEE